MVLPTKDVDRTVCEETYIAIRFRVSFPRGHRRGKLISLKSLVFRKLSVYAENICEQSSPIVMCIPSPSQ